MWRSLSTLAGVLLLLTACTSGPQPTLVPTSAAVAPGAKVVYVHLLGSTNDQGKVSVGQSARLTLLSWPVIYRADTHGTSMDQWASSNVSQMQTCVSFDNPCTLSGQWITFTPSPSAGYPGASKSGVEKAVDWVGPRTLWVVVQFRDTSGKIVPAVVDDSKGPIDVVETSAQVVGVWNQTTPIAALPSSAQTAIAATRIAFPVSGSVMMEGGRCCIGGVAGTTVTATVSFTATSPFGTVQQMRIQAGLSCADESAIAGAAWEPFVPSKTYPIQAAINFVGFDVSVQYRDVQGNLSPVSCATISVEGSPPATP